MAVTIRDRRMRPKHIIVNLFILLPGILVLYILSSVRSEKGEQRSIDSTLNVT